MIFTTFLFYLFGLTLFIGPINSIKNVDDSDSILFENGFVTCYSDCLVIHLYYFPYGDKTIKYNDIRSCDLLSHDNLSFFETKTWGMAFSPIWWHCDLRRHWRETYIILDANQWPKIGLTMDNNDTIKVYELIKQKMPPTSLEKKPDIHYEI
jgi:hypothetical protein